VGPILDENWQLKKQMTSQISDQWIDACYERARLNGAAGGKLLGAGGGGFLLLYCEKQHQDKLRAALGDLRDMKFSFDRFGTQVIHYEDNNVWSAERISESRPVRAEGCETRFLGAHDGLRKE
jgi:D-glycero-alpha-D-manno-heptose-7-phosphate kinase